MAVLLTPVPGVTNLTAGQLADGMKIEVIAGPQSTTTAIQNLSGYKSGTFISNGATAVVVADTRITANSSLAFALKTIGGTPAGPPFLSAVTVGVGFSVKVAAGDTSTYNYVIIN